MKCVVCDSSEAITTDMRCENCIGKSLVLTIPINNSGWKKSDEEYDFTKEQWSRYWEKLGMI